MSMNFQEALDLALKVREESGYTLFIENVGLDPEGRNVRMRDTNTGQVYHFYSPEEWEEEKRKHGWQEQMHWRPQPGGHQE